MTKMDVHFSSATDLWYTPPGFFAELDKEFNFVLDPCANKGNYKCANWFGPDHPDPSRRNGLEQDWASEVTSIGGGSVFMNPPYGRTIKLWVAAANKCALNGITCVCLLPARTDTQWFHDYCIHNEVRFIKGRLKFGGNKNSAPFPSCVVVMKGRQ